MQGSAPRDPALRDVVLLAIAVGGLVMCLVLMFEGMRAVMDIGGYCAEGGPYVIETHCPEGATPALLLGTFGLFGFVGLGMWAGAKVGGYGWLPLLAWTGLFASLGWNFLEYGLLNPPGGQIEWGWLIPGVMFQVMAWAPLVFVVVGFREARRGSGRPSRSSTITAPTLRGPGQPARDAESDADVDRRPPPVPEAHRVEAVGPVRRDELQAIDALMGAVVAGAAAAMPADPLRREAANAVSPASPAGAVVHDPTEFPEGTQALLDRLERLADMRDRGLLGPEEYETAKDAVMRELEARS